MSAQKLKHEATIKKVFSGMHEPWMTEADKASFDAFMMEVVGAEFNEHIDRLVSLGFDKDAQETHLTALIKLGKSLR